MERQITLTLPEIVYQQAEQMASVSHRPLAEVLIDVIDAGSATLYVDPNRPAMLQEKAAFLAMHAELAARYDGQYVAMFGGLVVDHDKDVILLVRRIRQQYPGEVILVKRVESDPDRLLEFRSPRLQ